MKKEKYEKSLFYNIDECLFNLRINEIKYKK